MADILSNLPYYEKENLDRGIALVFVNGKFENPKLVDLPASTLDAVNLKKSLSHRGFEVEICMDFTYDQIINKISEVANELHDLNQCLFVAFSTHGGEDGVLLSKDKEYELDEIIDKFTAENCPSLKGKPKIFVVDACRGINIDRGVELKNSGALRETNRNYSIPLYADFLIVYSSYPNYVSFSKSDTGSIFLHTLCKELDEKAKDLDILTLLTLVNRRVAFESASKKKQMPCISSMLTSLLKFSE
jgi:caspase-like apoptosis-related cysteine protease